MFFTCHLLAIYLKLMTSGANLKTFRNYASVLMYFQSNEVKIPK